MHYLQADDGEVSGPFESLEAALRCDIESMAVFSLDEYQARAKVLHENKNWLVNDFTDAKALVLEVDHVVIEVRFSLVSNHEPEDAYFNIAGEVATDPAKVIQRAHEWAAYGPASSVSLDGDATKGRNTNGQPV